MPQSMQPPPKRALRPTASQPTTAEFYGQQHGIPEDIQAALQNVGRKGRMAVSQGRTLDRTQSFPVYSLHSNPFTSSSSDIPSSTTGGFNGFMTSQQTYEHAELLIKRDIMKQRELRPYSDTLTATSSSSALPGPGSSPPGHRHGPLRFDADGIEEDQAGGENQKKGRKVSGREFRKSTKRKDEGSDSETETETDGDEDIEDKTGVELSNPGMSFGSSTTVTTGDDFPPVFKSPQISQPELFGTTQKQILPSRLVRNMPGRTLGKTVSVPVGVFNRYGGKNAQTARQDGDGDVGMGGGEEEDGFDVSEWAASEEF